MSRSKNQDVALGLLSTISKMYDTFTNKELANKQIMARQEQQQIHNAHLLEVKQYDDSLKMQETELYRTYADNEKDMDRLRTDLEALNLSFTDYDYLDDAQQTPGGQAELKKLGVSYTDDFKVRYNAGKNIEENLVNIGNAINLQNQYKTGILQSLGNLHDGIKYFEEGLIGKAGYRDGTPLEWIKEYQSIVDESDLRIFMDTYSEYDANTNPGGFNINELEPAQMPNPDGTMVINQAGQQVPQMIDNPNAGLPVFMPDEFNNANGNTLKKTDYLNNQNMLLTYSDDDIVNELIYKGDADKIKGFKEFTNKFNTIGLNVPGFTPQDILNSINNKSVSNIKNAGKEYIKDIFDFINKENIPEWVGDIIFYTGGLEKDSIPIEMNAEMDKIRKEVHEYYKLVSLEPIPEGTEEIPPDLTAEKLLDEFEKAFADASDKWSAVYRPNEKERLTNNRFMEVLTKGIDEERQGLVDYNNEFMNFWDVSNKKQEIINENILFDSDDPKNQDARLRLKVWESDILKGGGKILPKDIFDDEERINNLVMTERAAIRRGIVTAETKKEQKILETDWDKRLNNLPTTKKIATSRDNIKVKLGTREWKNLPIVEEFGTSIKFLDSAVTPDTIKQHKVTTRSGIIDALEEYADSGFKNIDLTDELVGSGLEGKITTMDDLLKKMNTGTADEQDAWMKVFSDIVLGGPNQVTAAGKIWREGFLDKLDFVQGFMQDWHLGGEWGDNLGDPKNVDVISSWINHYNILDKGFEGHDDGTNHALAEIGYTYPKDIGQGRRMFAITLGTGDKVYKLGYDLGIGFENRAITRTLHDKEFFESQNIDDEYLEEVKEAGKSLWRIREDILEVVEGGWNNPNKKVL